MEKLPEALILIDAPALTVIVALQLPNSQPTTPSRAPGIVQGLPQCAGFPLGCSCPHSGVLPVLPNHVTFLLNTADPVP
jgi:hypothetical protein